MASYRQRQVQKFKILITGYLRELFKTDNIVPGDLINECALWLKQELYVEFSKYFNSAENFRLQIMIKGDNLNILQKSDVKRYKIRYHDLGTNGNQVHKTWTANIYPLKCLCYKTVKSWPIANISVQAFDDQNKLFAESECKKMARFHPVRRGVNVQTFNFDAVYSYWLENISKRDSVGINKWVESIMRLELIDDEYIAKKIFYYLLSEKRSRLKRKLSKDEKKKTKLKDIDYIDFEEFICDLSYDLYLEKGFAYFIRECLLKIPNMK